MVEARWKQWWRLAGNNGGDSPERPNVEHPVEESDSSRGLSSESNEERLIFRQNWKITR